MKKIFSENAPAPIGPYSHGFITKQGLFFASGQIPVDPISGQIPKGIAAQTEQCAKNVGALLESAGIGFENVIKTTCFLADINDFNEFNEVYARYFVSEPARSCVAVKDLPKGVLCEIECVAEGGAMAIEKELNERLFDQLAIVERLDRATKAGRYEEESEIIKNEINRKLYQKPPLISED